MNIKPIDQSAQKWQARAAIAGPAYTAGVQNPRTPWATAAKAAQQNYVAGVTAAANAGRYANGIAKAGDAKWLQGATTKGATRFAEGVQLAVGNWTAGFQPYQSALAALTLPPRGPTGSATNLQRVQAVDNALRQVKTGKGA